MLMDGSAYHGKSLPAKFARGYIMAFVHIFGLAATQSFIYWAAEQRFPNKDDRSVFLEPLEQHFSSKRETASYQQLDYYLVSLFYEGLAYNYSTPNHRSFKKAMRDVGKFWCLKSTLIVEGYEYDSITDILIPVLANSLDSSDITTTDQRIKLAFLETAFLKFAEESKIACNLAYRVEHAVLEIVDCPLCSNHQPPCQFFWGVIDGFLLWLDKHLPQKGDVPSPYIDTIKSNGHQIIISLQ